MVGRGSSSMRRVRIVVDDADDRQPGILRLWSAEVQTLPDRILAGPAAARDRVGHDDHRRRLAVVLFAERPAPQQTDAHHLEIARPTPSVYCAVGTRDRSSPSVPSAVNTTELRLPSNGSDSAAAAAVTPGSAAARRRISS